MKRLILSVALIAVCTSFAALTGPDDRAYSKIVVPDKALDSVRMAADELSRFLREIGVADLPVVHSADPGEAVILVGGVPAADKLPSDGFVIATKPGRFIIAGKDNPGRFSEFSGR